MELRCPDCCSSEMAHGPEGSRVKEMLCRNCGSRFGRDSALVRFGDCHDPGQCPVDPRFTFSGTRADRREDGDSASCTLHFLAEAVAAANQLLAEGGADARHLDRIAAFMTENRPWSGADVCEFVDRELRESGRHIPDCD